MSNLNTAVTPEAIAALKNMSSDIEELSTQLKQEVLHLKEAFEEHQEGLGHHSNQIRQLLEELGVNADEANVPVKKLTRRLTRAATLRNDLIQNAPYGRSSR